MAEPSLIFLDKALKVTGRFSAFFPELISLEDVLVGIKHYKRESDDCSQIILAKYIWTEKRWQFSDGGMCTIYLMLKNWLPFHFKTQEITLASCFIMLAIFAY